jgi:hypothetical protein
MSAKSSGYSGTPLAKKLGIAANSRVVTKRAPGDYRELVEPIPAGAVFESVVSQTTDIVHVFVERKEVLKAELASLRISIKPDGVVWISWTGQTSVDNQLPLSA